MAPLSDLGSRYVEAFVKQLGATIARATGSSGTIMTVKLPASIIVEDVVAPPEAIAP